MKVLFIGGTGIISSACSELAISKGIDLYHLNRGISTNTRKINGVKNIISDIWNIEESEKALHNYTFDVIVDFIAFAPDHLSERINILKNKCKQYIFISSASIYETPPSKLPVTENTKRENHIWEYSQNKIACEDFLLKQFSENNFPITIVRPSHTYDKTLIPLEGGYTVLKRIIDNKPIIVHGDGSSLWTLTHHKDFAVGLIGLLGKEEAIGQSYHITSDEYLSWNTIISELANALGKVAKIIPVPSKKIATYNKEIGDSLLGDKTHSMIFDNSKIKKIVPEFNCSIPFSKGAKEIVEWYSNTQHQIDPELDKMFDTIIKENS